MNSDYCISTHTSIQSDGTSEEGSLTATLTPWELWLVKKTEDERRKIEKERQEKLVEEKQRRENAKAKQLLQAKARHAFQEWKQRKLEAEKKKKCKERREMEQRREAESKRIAAWQHKQSDNFASWCVKKKESEKQKTLLEESMRRLTIEKEVERRLNAEMMYEQWQREVEARHIKRGYSICTDPKPTFCNPNPWIGPCDGRDEEHITKTTDRRSKVAKDQGRLQAKRKPRKRKQPLSPPLLFKCRRDKAYHVAWGRQR